MASIFRRGVVDHPIEGVVTPTLSQVVEQESSVSSSIQNGFTSGNYSGFTIGSDGTVTATFNNGQKLNVGQLALGNVVNLQGLQDKATAITQQRSPVARRP